MRNRNKVIRYAVYPDGTRFEITYKNRTWWYAPNKFSSDMDGVRQHVISSGGFVETTTNPEYRPTTKIKHTTQIDQMINQLLT